MPPIPTGEFAGHFRSLSATERRQFVADLWERRGHETTVQDGVVRCGGEPREQIVVVGAWPRPADWRVDDVDTVVSTHDNVLVRTYARTQGATFVPPAKLRELLIYSIDESVADQLTAAYFGVPASMERQPAEQQQSVVAPALVGLVVLVAVLAIVVAVPVVEEHPWADDEPTLVQSAMGPPAEPPVTPPEGITEDGLFRYDTVRTNYFSHIDDGSYVVSLNYTGPPNWLFGDAVAFNSTTRIARGEGYIRSTNRTTIGENGSIHTERVVSHDTEMKYISVHRFNDTATLSNSTHSYTREPTYMPGYIQVVVSGALDPDHVASTSVEQFERDGTSYYRVTRVGNETTFALRFSELRTEEYRTVAEFTPDGKLNSLSIEYTEERTGEQAIIELTYAEFGSVSGLEFPPDWAS